MPPVDLQAGPFVIPTESDCHLCWLVERVERGGGPVEIALCYAIHTGAACASGAGVPICDRHQAMVDVTARHFMEAMHAAPDGAPG